VLGGVQGRVVDHVLGDENASLLEREVSNLEVRPPDEIG
jgi:hypothetical protein